jgi:hypothetical protein
MTPEVQLKTSLHGGVWSARCDAKQLESALPNLAVNAPDAMPDGGTLTGLGLSQVYGFVRRSGGFVRLESTVGRGTTVPFYSGKICLTRSRPGQFTAMRGPRNLRPLSRRGRVGPGDRTATAIYRNESVASAPSLRRLRCDFNSHRDKIRQ